MLTTFVLAAILSPAMQDPVLAFYRGTWHCEGRNFAGKSYSLTYRFSVDPDAPTALRVQTVYIVGGRRNSLSGQVSPTGNGWYLETGAARFGMWVSATKGWSGNKLIWHDVMLPGGNDQDQYTLTRLTNNSFSELDQRLGPNGKPDRINTTATCRRSG